MSLFITIVTPIPIAILVRRSLNHDSVIVGWDDDFPKENFNMDLEGDGAFICTNSWGEDFGDQGYFMYLIMILILESIILYTRELNLLTIMTKIYQSDLCGWVGRSGMGKIQPGLPMLIAQKKGKSWRQPVFMQQGRIQNIRSMWHVIFRTRTVQMCRKRQVQCRDHGLNPL